MATRRGWYLALLLTVLGCGSEQLAGGPTLDGGGGSGSGGSGSGGSPPVECPAPGYAEPSDPIRIGSFSAKLTDDAGSPLTGVLAQVCGLDLCIDVDVASNGSIVRAVNADFLKPAFKYGNGVGYAKFAQLLEPSSDGAIDLGTVISVPLPPIASGAALAPGTTAASSGVELELAPDFAAEIDFFDFDTPEEQAFRAVAIPLEIAPPAVDPSLGFELVYALTPAGALLCPAAVLTLPNTPGWPANAAAEVWVHGISIEEPWAPYGGWAKVSDAAVTADGSAITTRGHAGLPTLSVIGIRRAL